MILMIQLLLLIQMINHVSFQRLRVMGIPQRSSCVTHLSKSIKALEVVSLLLFLKRCSHYGDNQGVMQVTFTCSKLSIEIIENSAKYVKSLQQKHQNEVYDVVLEFLLLTEYISHLFLLFLLVNDFFEQVNIRNSI